MVELYDSIESLQKIEQQWRLLESSANVRVFQTWNWCVLGLKYKICGVKCKPFVMKWSQEGKTDVVILPAMIDENGVLRFINDLHSDICDSLYDDRNDANRYWAYKEFADVILSDKRIRGVRFQKLNPLGEAVNYFSVLLPGCTVYKDNAFSYLISPETDDFIASQGQLKRKDRDRLKAIKRKSDSAEFSCYAKNQGVQFPLKEIKELRNLMANNVRGGTSFLSDEMIDFMSSLYDAGVCEVPMLRKDGVVQTLAFRLIKDHIVNCWVVLYRDSKATSELYVRYMAEKTRTDHWIFDFGVGVYGYKLGTFRPKLGCTLALEHRRGTANSFVCIVHGVFRMAKDIIKAQRQH